MAGRRGKLIKVSDMGALVEHIWGTFDLVVSKIILGHLKLISKTACRKEKLAKIICLCGFAFSIHVQRVHLTFKLLVILKSFPAFMIRCDFSQGCISAKVPVEKNWDKPGILR